MLVRFTMEQIAAHDRGVALAVRCEDIRAVCDLCAKGRRLDMNDGVHPFAHGQGVDCPAAPVYARLLADGHALEDVVRKVKEAK